MVKYNLDEKRGLMKMFRKKPSKFLLKDDFMELSHFNSYSSVKMLITDVTDTSVKLRFTEEGQFPEMEPNDIVVLTYFAEKDYYIISGKVESIEGTDPKEITINIENYNKAKDLRKEEKRYVSLKGAMNKDDSPDKKSDIIIKVMGLRDIKVDCEEEFQIKDIVEILATIEEKNRLNFRGEIVRKEKISDLFEYGISVKEITESNSRLMHGCVGGALE